MSATGLDRAERGLYNVHSLHAYTSRVPSDEVVVSASVFDYLLPQGEQGVHTRLPRST
jgi:hypothetical protein